MQFIQAYVAFASRADPPLTVAGQLRVPDWDSPEAAGNKVPAVLICHGSSGIDGRGSFHAEALNRAGIATLEIDMWAARGVQRGATGRPKSVSQTLPDAFGALDFLSRQPEIDPARIAIMGFSWGGVVTMLAATQPYAEALAAPGQKFAAHAAFYPVLWSYNVVPGHEFASLTGAPVLVQAGGEDAYDTPASVRAFLDRLAPDVRDLVELVVHGGATHAFDRAGPAKIIHDPFAHNGAGGPVRFEHHPAAALAAREAVVNFLAGVFSPVAPGSEPQTGPGVRR